MAKYRIELPDDEFEIINADTDKEAISWALDEHDLVYNVIKLDDDYNEIETIF